jgi:hypothetical protein
LRANLFAGRLARKRNIKAQLVKALDPKPAVRSELSNWLADHNRNGRCCCPGAPPPPQAGMHVFATTLPLDSRRRAARADQVLHIFVAVKKARNLPLELCRMERFAERSSAREKLALDLRW